MPPPRVNPNEWAAERKVTRTSHQGLTLVHFSAQLERFVWHRGARVGVV